MSALRHGSPRGGRGRAVLKTLRRIIDWTGPWKRNLYLGALCSFLMTWATAGPVMIAAWMLGAVVDDACGVAPLDPNAPLVALGAVAACIALRFLFSYGKNRLQESIGYEVAPEERIRIGEALKRVPLGFFSRVKTGDILSIATTELGMLELQGMKMVDAVLNGYLSVLAIVCCLGVMCPPAALVALVGVAGSAAALWSINRASARWAPVAHEATERLSGAIVEYVRGLATAKSYGRENAAMVPIRRACSDMSRVRIRIELAFTPLNVTHLSILKIASVAVIAVAAAFTAAGDLPLWMFLALALFSFTMFSGVEGVNDSAHVLGDLADVMDRLEELKHAPVIDADGVDIALDRHDIAFDDVCFSYGEGSEARQVLRGVSFTVPEGSTCAIVGPSGSGKTTIANLMARFYDVDSGSVRVGGRDVREFTCESLLANFAMVFQSVYLFNDTVAANIAFGRPGATRAEVEQAARRACCHDFIMQLPRGYDTVVGEGGSSLSGGQRQRISIARALLKDAPIVILDEATASVDPENEALIQAALAELAADKTVVVIAHRLATVEAADQILVVDDGAIVQRGTHEELCAQEGLYRRFVEIRAKAEGWRLDVHADDAL